MKSRRRSLLIFVLAILVLIPSVGIVVSLATPRLVEVSPAVDAVGVPAGSSLRLTFSTPMQPDSVVERLEIEPEQSGELRWEDPRTLVFDPERSWPSGQTIRVSLAPGARAGGLFPFAVREPAAWSFQVSFPRLAYLYPADGPANLYLLDPLSGETQLLTDSPGGVLEYDSDAAGSRIYYSVKGTEGSGHIYRLEGVNRATSTHEADESGAALSDENPQEAPGVVFEGEPELVTECFRASCRYPRISPEGDYLAYERTAFLGGEGATFPQVWLLPIHESGFGEPRLAGHPDHQTVQPDWSPAGMLTFYDNSLQAYVMLDPDRGERHEFSNDTGQPGDWDPTGRYFVAPQIRFDAELAENLATDLAPIAVSHLIRFDIETETIQDLTTEEYLEDAVPAYSPTGGRLALARKYIDAVRWTPGRQLWIMDADGENARQITDDPHYNHFEFAWSPDGRQLAFVRFNQSELTEPPELWLADPVSRRTTLLQIGAYAPKWVP